MKVSEDVSKLFAMFGTEKASDYREVYEADQRQATFERWPVFQAIKLGPPPESIQVARPTRPSTATPKTPSPGSGAPSEAGATSLQSLFKRLEKTEVNPPRAAIAPLKAEADPMPEPEPSTISSLFKRLGRS